MTHGPGSPWYEELGRSGNDGEQSQKFAGILELVEAPAEVEDLAGQRGIDSSAGHPLELGFNLGIGHRVLVVAAREFILGYELATVGEGGFQAVGNAARVAGGELRIAMNPDLRH